MNTDIYVEEIYDEFHLFVHYIHLEDLEKWINNSLIVLNFDLKIENEDLILIQGKMER